MRRRDKASCVLEKPAELGVLASPEVVSFVEEMFPDLDALGRVPERGVGSGGEAVREARPQGAL